ncbi:AMP-binding protein [Paracoccus sp. Z330]|uniref:AMP-binding protein n=1 Tax=Paracoccus onchidii TaxID=3017813 RepID=A0ABT4ZCJ5_9RHOB|nr:AMP-binding protein [Paracoccus onchidii]MDB6176990.1 AMP-binding protein [Paracoccus onchidii]
MAVDRRDPGLFLGYLDQPQETAARFRGDWFLTGDRAVMTHSGAVTLLGREHDIMNAGGYRVAPAEIEEVISTHPECGDVAATEVSLNATTSIIALFWTGPAPESDLRRLAESELARYKQPRKYIWLDALPRTATGKINRRALRQDFGEPQHDTA